LPQRQNEPIKDKKYPKDFQKESSQTSHKKKENEEAKDSFASEPPSNERV